MVNLCIDCGDPITPRSKRCAGCKGVQNKSMKPKAKYVLERMGEIVGDVETIIPGTYYKRDLWNMFDLISINDKGKIKFVQVFSAKSGGGDFTTHYTKMYNKNPEILERIIEGGNTFELWGFRGLLKTETKLCFLVNKYDEYEGVGDGSYEFLYRPLRVYFDGTIKELI